MKHLEMRDLDQSRYTINQVLERQKPDDSVKELLVIFNERLSSLIELKQKTLIVRTCNIGFSHFCNDKKAFLFLNVCQKFLSLKFFTGHKDILGLEKGIWLNKNDNMGSKPYHVFDNTTLNQALQYAIEAHKIAEEWSK